MGHLVQVCQRTVQSTRCGEVLQTRTTSFLYYQKGQAWLALACEFMNFSSPNNLPHQTSKYKPLALKMKTPANVTDLYLEAWLNKQHLSGFGLAGTRSVPRVAQSSQVNIDSITARVPEDLWTILPCSRSTAMPWLTREDGGLALGIGWHETSSQRPWFSMSWSRRFVTGLTSGDF